jgi:hypothetical protein
VDGSDIRLDLQHGKVVGEVRRWRICDEGDRGRELTRRGGSAVAAASIPVALAWLRRPASDKKSRGARRHS